jgi:2-isopropylmalate synthase
LAGIEAGAHQVECTVNGIGERAGNAALEEIVMGLKVREDELGHHTGVRSERLYRASRLLSYLTGIHPQPNKAIVGRNAFAHEAGIHQHGVLKDPSTYEIMTPQMVGVPQSRLVLGKHSGRHGLEARLQELGYTLDPEELDRVAASFKELADRKKDILDEDLISILNHGVMEDVPEAYRIDGLGVICGGELSEATITVLDEDGVPRIAEGEGDGPIAAVFAAADTLHNFKVVLEDLKIRAATPGRDAVGEVTIRARVDGQTFTGRGGSTDVVLASAQAYMHLLNKAVQARELEARHFAARTDWGV